jgi:hypothetical protein
MWRRLNQRGILGTTPIFVYYNQALRLPRNSARATIIFQKHKQIRMTGWEHHGGISQSPHRPYYWDHSIANTITNLTNDQILLFTNHVRNGSITLVSDGSFNPQLELGTAAWILESLDKTLQIKGTLITPGESEAQCAHHSELSGLLGGIRYVNDMCNKLGICSGNTKMGCDGEGAIILVSNFHQKINSSRKHFDMLGAIHNALELSPLKWEFHHIRGHQDDLLEFQDLGRDEQLNVMADTLAKEKLRSFALTVNWRYKRPINISYEQCSVDWTNQFGTRVRISSHLQKSLQSHIQHVSARKYWTKKKSISNYHERQIDWNLLHKSHLALDNHRHRWLSKWLTGFCGVGIMLQWYRHQSHSDCPRCGIPGETTAHIIQCQDNGAKILWATEVQKIERWMTDNDGHPEMTQIICSILRNWQSLRGSMNPEPEERTLILALHQQQRIGWFNFIQGFFSMQWRICQTEHLT